MRGRGTLEEHERTLLVQAVRTVDLLEKLDAEVRRGGPLVESPQGQKAHPAATEAPSSASPSLAFWPRFVSRLGPRVTAGRRPSSATCRGPWHLRHPWGCLVRCRRPSLRDVDIL